MSKIIDGKSIALKIRAEINNDSEILKNEYNIVPGLSVIIIGDNPASNSYVKMKERACKENGINSNVYRLPIETKEIELLKLLNKLNTDTSVHGILVQLPLPKHIDEKKVIENIDPKKDVDGFTPVNTGRLMNGQKCFKPCTPYGIVELIKFTKTLIEGKNAVIIGRSNIVGKPLSMLLLNENATVTICHSKTINLKNITSSADILISAIGKPNFIVNSMVKKGAIAIDVGINRIKNKIVGDLDFESVRTKTSWITPVPGGVGPMTITMLLKNTIEAAKYESTDIYS